MLLLSWPGVSLAAEWTVNAFMHHYEPAQIAIRTGDTVRWVNLTAQAHELTFAVDPDRGPDGGGGPHTYYLQTAPLKVRFDHPGEYVYLCTWHGMRAVVRVKPIQ